MYCEYFKLYKIIVSYVIENVTDKKILENIKGNNFPVYKDLEPFKDYKFEITLEIHENILVLLNSINSIINNRENELSIHKSKQLIGLNIDNFVYSFNYEIILMKEKVNLFLSYIDFFHKLHTKYLKRFSKKIQLMSTHINSDIQFDENVENDSPNKKNDEHLLDNEILIYNDNNTSIDNKSFKLAIDTIDFDSSNIFEYYECDLNTSSDTSYKSSESKKMKLPKFIKKGFKRVKEIITGCNDKDNYSNNSENNELVLENLSIKNSIDHNVTTSISLNDFNENVSECELKVQEANENNIIIIEEGDISTIEQEKRHNEKETQTNNFNTESLVFIVEEEPTPFVEESQSSAVEEEPTPFVEESQSSAVEEEPTPFVEESQSSAVQEEPTPLVEESQSSAVQEELTPLVEESQPSAVEEEPSHLVEESQPSAVEEEPTHVVEESIN